MKKITFLAAAVLFSGFAMAQNAAAPVSTLPLEKRVEFKNEKVSLGKIPLNKPVEFTIEMKNIGADTVTLVNVQAGCGCTAPNFTPNEKFGPGQTSKILIRYNGSSKGSFTKYSTIYFDGGQTKQVSFAGEGVEEPAPNATANKSGTPVKN